MFDVKDIELYLCRQMLHGTPGGIPGGISGNPQQAQNRNQQLPGSTQVNVSPLGLYLC